ncbi:hypothetical protein [Pseudomonas saliphila]|uniref:hypothetical protein n=1 Tax=Pseudomonas saliphila TaxID=2586906 RepID=UPI00123B6465|nr:hypothetical protein [Pseudomonas saliphila]
MEVTLTNDIVEMRKYRAKITDLGFLTPDTAPDSKRYGTYKYIVIRDLDDDRDITLENVAVGLRCAPLVKEGSELTFLYGHSQDGESVNCLLAVVAGGEVKDDYRFFRSQIDLGINALLAYKLKTTWLAIAAFGMSIPLMFWIIPGIIVLVLGIILWGARRKIQKMIKDIELSIPTQAGFERILTAL